MSTGIGARRSSFFNFHRCASWPNFGRAVSSTRIASQDRQEGREVLHLLTTTSKFVQRPPSAAGKEALSNQNKKAGEGIKDSTILCGNTFPM